jgi:hypothetical protein
MVYPLSYLWRAPPRLPQTVNASLTQASDLIQCRQEIAKSQSRCTLLAVGILAGACALWSLGRPLSLRYCVCLSSSLLVISSLAAQKAAREWNALVTHTRDLILKDPSSCPLLRPDLKRTVSFAQAVFHAVQTEISQSPLQKHFLYSIFWKNRKVGLLIGTVHLHSLKVATDPVLYRAVRSCGALMTESASAQSQSLTSRDPLGYPVDAYLAQAALRDGIPVSALDTEASRDKIRQDLDSREIEPAPDLERLRPYAALLPYTWLPFQVAYLNASLPAQDDEESKERERDWLYGDPQIVARLKERKPDEKPIGIVVGCAHCPRLISDLTREGFSIA